MTKKFTIYTDGGARNNPGPAGAGFVIYQGRKKIFEQGVYLGVATNNQAEYQAVLLALKQAQKIKAREVTVLMDSELAVRQINREYKIKNQELGKLFVQIWNLLPAFDKIVFKHIPREKNREADRLVNQAIDEKKTPLTQFDP